MKKIVIIIVLFTYIVGQTLDNTDKITNENQTALITNKINSNIESINFALDLETDILYVLSGGLVVSAQAIANWKILAFGIDVLATIPLINPSVSTNADRVIGTAVVNTVSSSLFIGVLLGQKPRRLSYALLYGGFLFKYENIRFLTFERQQNRIGPGIGIKWRGDHSKLNKPFGFIWGGNLSLYFLIEDPNYDFIIDIELALGMIWRKKKMTFIFITKWSPSEGLIPGLRVTKKFDFKNKSKL